MAEYYEGRIIPAYAGSTPGPRSDRRPFKDHPRIRGEHYGDMSAYELSSGSSPHTRGARALGLPALALGRIIPAYAGSTSGHTCPGRDGSDHPRIRGEHVTVYSFVASVNGSSPHTRGAPTSTVPTLPWRRIIPAYAGSTSLTSLVMRSCWDHPRIRGEHRPV